MSRSEAEVILPEAGPRSQHCHVLLAQKDFNYLMKPMAQPPGIGIFVQARHMLFDCFQFFNELDLLEIRLAELYPVVDKFVICESILTHSGNRKSLRFKENLKRYEKYADKINYIVYNGLDVSGAWTGKDHWNMESSQRTFLIKGINLTNLADDDLIMVSDLDEIPRRATLHRLVDRLHHKTLKPPVGLCMPLFYGKMTHKVVRPREHRHWNGPAIISGALLKEVPDLHDWYRKPRKGYSKIKNAGWHFSYMGNIDTVIEKLESFAHQEGNNEQVKNAVRANLGQCRDLFDRKGYKLRKTNIDHSYPQLVLNEPERFKEFL